MQKKNYRNKGKKIRMGKQGGKLQKASACFDRKTSRTERGVSWRRRTKKRNRWKKKKKTRKYVPRKMEKRISRWRRKKGQTRVMTYGGRKKEGEKVQPSHRRVKGKQRRPIKARMGSRHMRRKPWVVRKAFRKMMKSSRVRLLRLRQKKVVSSSVRKGGSLPRTKRDFISRLQQRSNKQAMGSTQSGKLATKSRISKSKNKSYGPLKGIKSAMHVKRKRRRVRSVSDVSGEAHNGCRGKGKRRL